MTKENQTTEQIILQEAEKEFLKKGYEKTKISTIAKNANVNHAMLHYYFRTKENIFNIIFQKKIELLAKQLSASFDGENDFIQQLEMGITSHFNFIKENPDVIFFILREVSSDSSQMKTLRNIVKPKVESVLTKLDRAINKEIEKGTIRDITAIDLFMNIIALNASSVFVVSLFQKVGEDMDNISSTFLDYRKQHVKDFIINSIRK